VELKDADALLEDVAARLHEIPIGQAPIDNVIERLAREGKLKKLGVLKLILIDGRQRVIRAWWWARFVTAEQTRQDRIQTIVAPSKAYRKRLSRLGSALTAFEREDHDTVGSPLDFRAALGDLAATVDDLRQCVRAAERAANRVSKALVAMEQEYGGRGRLGSPLFFFAKALAPLWHELTESLPSVTHDPLKDIWTGPFVDLVVAAAATVNQPELSGNVAVAADKAASWYRRKFARQLSKSALPK
jgi:hypothetical protein